MSHPDQPAYHDFTVMDGPQARSQVAERSARQITATVGPLLSRPWEDVDVLDIGSGYGDTARILARTARSVVAIEPTHRLAHESQRASERLVNMTVRHDEIQNLRDHDAFDLVVLDNVYEHLPDHHMALERIYAALRPHGLLYLLVPNRLWPMEAHYRLPALAWLPLPTANAYLRLSRRGRDYADASYAPTWWSLKGDFSRQPGLEWNFVLPGDPGATRSGAPVHYRWGIRALRSAPALWCVSKAFLVVARKLPK